MKQCGDRRLVGDVAPEPDAAVASIVSLQPSDRLVKRALVDIGEHDAGPFIQQSSRAGLPDATGATGNQRDAPRKRLASRLALEFCFLEQPVLDVKGRLFLERAVSGHPRGLTHHMDRIDIELAGNARRALVAGEAAEADTGDQVNDRIRIAHGRGVTLPAAFVIGGIVLAVGIDRRRQARDQGLLVLGPGIERQHQRPDLRAQEMIGAGGTKRGQVRERAATDKIEHLRTVVEVSDLVGWRADQPANAGHDRSGDLPPSRRRQWCKYRVA